MTLINRQEMVVDLQPRLLSFYVLVPLCYKPVCAFLRLQMQGCDPKEPTSVFVLVWCLGTPLLCVYIYICRCRSDVPRCRYIYICIYMIYYLIVCPHQWERRTHRCSVKSLLFSSLAIAAFSTSSFGLS